MTGPATPHEDQFSKLDTNIPHSARIWNYWLGGKDNFASDREAGRTDPRSGSGSGGLGAR
jgi:S-adenosyl methyltransferase